VEIPRIIRRLSYCNFLLLFHTSSFVARAMRSNGINIPRFGLLKRYHEHEINVKNFFKLYR